MGEGRRDKVGESVDMTILYTTRGRGEINERSKRSEMGKRNEISIWRKTAAHANDGQVKNCFN